MDAVVERCAGLGVHRDNVVATVRVPSEDRRRFKLSTRTFRATIGGLTELREWLAAFGVTLVGMEATGVYWTPVFQVLEDRFECWLLKRSTPSQCPRPQDGCQRLGVDLPAGRARAGAAELRAAAGDPPASGSDPVS